jgi:hypothetical protein
MYLRLGLRASRGFFRAPRASSRKFDRNGYFDYAYWEELFPTILEEQAYKAGNAGQEAILTGDFLEAATEYCIEFGEEFEVEEYQAYLYEALGDSKYNAISIIIGESAEQLVIAWDDSFGGDGIGVKMFHSGLR